MTRCWPPSRPWWAGGWRKGETASEPVHSPAEAGNYEIGTKGARKHEKKVAEVPELAADGLHDLQPGLRGNSYRERGVK